MSQPIKFAALSTGFTSLVMKLRQPDIPQVDMNHLIKTVPRYKIEWVRKMAELMNCLGTIVIMANNNSGIFEPESNSTSSCYQNN